MVVLSFARPTFELVSLILTFWLQVTGAFAVSAWSTLRIPPLVGMTNEVVLKGSSEQLVSTLADKR